MFENLLTFANQIRIGMETITLSFDPNSEFAAALEEKEGKLHTCANVRKLSKVLAAILLMMTVALVSGRLNAQTYKGHEYVDLALPSGTLWATCNVGADTPEGYGYYFAWGETTTKTTYDWNTYKYGTGKALTKYCHKFNYGKNGLTDNLTVLQSNDDAATANWGSGWCMPTKEQWSELLENTSSQETTQNGVQGILFTSKNGRSLFLPDAGTQWRGMTESECGYWSSSLHSDYPSCAWGFRIRVEIDYFDPYTYWEVDNLGRGSGLPVRAVRSSH